MKPLLAVAALALLGLAPERASAQYYSPYYGQDLRAYNYFLNSNAPLKTYSSFSPGYNWYYSSPYSFQRYYRSPGFVRQRVTPLGLEQTTVTPSYGAYSANPFGASNYFVPSYQYRTYTPFYYGY